MTTTESITISCDPNLPKKLAFYLAKVSLGE